MLNMKYNSSLQYVTTVLNCFFILQTHQPESGVSFGNYSPSLSVPGRRPSSRHNSGTATLPDPLGIFSSVPSPQQESHQPSSTIHKIADKPRVVNTKTPSAVAVSTPCCYWPPY